MKNIKKCDKSYLMGIFNLEKNISNEYNIFLNKSSNDYLYENIFSMLEDTNDMIREIYNLLYRLNIIKLFEVDSKVLDDNINKLESFIKKLA